MEWGDVRVFLAVARAGTLGGAARALNLSQPTMGRRLRALEIATGQILFQRTVDGFVLTEEGSNVLSLAEQMEDSALAMERRLAGHEGKLEGTLKVSSADWFGAFVLPPVVAEFTRTHPHVNIEILTGTRLFNLAQREADIAFRLVPFDSPDIVQRRLIQMRYGVYVACDGPDPAVGDGTGVRLILMDSDNEDFPDIVWLRTKFPNARSVLRSNNRNVQSRMCGRGLGIAVLPRPVGDQLANLRRLETDDDPPSREIWMGYHRDLKRLGRLRAFVELAVKHLAA